MAIGVMRGTAAYAKIAATADWVLDAADPWSVAPTLTTRPVIVQEAGMYGRSCRSSRRRWRTRSSAPTVSTPPATHQGRQGGNGALVSTYFPTASHGEILLPTATGTAMVTQAIGFLTSLGALLPAP